MFIYVLVMKNGLMQRGKDIKGELFADNNTKEENTRCNPTNQH